jgi:hypothetical protein
MKSSPFGGSAGCFDVRSVKTGTRRWLNSTYCSPDVEDAMNHGTCKHNYNGKVARKSPTGIPAHPVLKTSHCVKAFTIQAIMVVVQITDSSDFVRRRRWAEIFNLCQDTQPRYARISMRSCCCGPQRLIDGSGWRSSDSGNNSLTTLLVMYESLEISSDIWELNLEHKISVILFINTRK